MPATISEHLAIQARVRPDAEALVYRRQVLRYREFDGEVARVAALLNELGLDHGDRVAIYMEKCIEEALCIYGVNRAGGVFIDVNHLLKAPQVAYILADSGSRFLITTRQRLRALGDLAATCPTLSIILLIGAGEAPDMAGVDFVEWTRGSAAPIRHRVTERDPAAIIYTSGSTGQPKGVVLSNRNLVAGAESVVTYIENRPDDRILSVLPFSFDYGLNQLTTAVLVGACCVLINYLLPNDILKAIAHHRITGLALIPPLWLQLLATQWDDGRFPSLRYLTNSGGALPEGAVRALRQRLPQSRLYLMYGLTEAFRATYLPPAQALQRPTSIGRAIPNAEIWVLNDRGEHCGPDEPGELVQRGAHVALGYWNDSERTRERFRPNPFALAGVTAQEWVVYSGDRVRMDADGYLYFIGRLDEMIKTSGYRVSPAEVEASLYRDTRIQHAAVFGIADDIMGQVVVAVVSPRDAHAIDVAQLAQRLAAELPGYMVPRHTVVRAALPLTPNGKIDRTRVKAEFLEELGRQ